MLILLHRGSSRPKLKLKERRFIMDKYVKGPRNYHVVVDDAPTTKCNWNYKLAHARVENTKEKAGWPTCPACAAGGLSDAVKTALRK